MVCLLWICSGIAYAQPANYESVPVGGRGAAMGGAYLALADDASAAFYNPAGLASIRQRGISLSATAYGVQSTKVTGFVRAYGESIDLKESSLRIFPTATSYVLPFDSIGELNHTAAFSIIVPYNDSFEGTQNLSLTDSYLDLDVFQSRSQQVMWAGPSYAIGGERWRVGASLMLQYASFNQKNLVGIGISSDSATGGTTTLQTSQFTQQSGSAFALMPALGAQYRLDDRLAFGVTLRLPAIHVTGSSETFHTNAQSELEADAAGNPLAPTSVFQDTYRKVQAGFVQRSPVMFGGGFAYQAPSELRVAFDARAYLPVGRHDRISGAPVLPNRDLPGEYGTTEEYDPTETDPGHAFVMNFAAGIEIPVVEGLYALGGFHTDFSSIRDEDIFEANDVRVNMYHFTAGVRSVSESGSLVAGLAFAIGSGKAIGFDFADVDNLEVRADATRWSLGIFMAGTAFLGDEPEDDEALPAGGNPESGDTDPVDLGDTNGTEANPYTTPDASPREAEPAPANQRWRRRSP